jgi:type I restriction enzyme, S subunit
MSDYINNLPRGWVNAPLDAFCQIVQGQSPPGNTYNTDHDGLPFFQGKAEFGDLYPTAVKWCSFPMKIAEKDDVLISIRAPVGPTNLCPTRACIGRGLAAIRPLGGIAPRYLLYGLRNTQNRLVAQSTGSTFGAISGDALRNHKLPVAPLSEQVKVVAEIEKQCTRLDAGIAPLKRVQASLKRYRTALLKAAIEGRLVPTEAELARHEGRSYEPGEDLLKRIITERRTRWEAEQLNRFGISKSHRGGKQKAEYTEPVGPCTTDLVGLPEGWAWARAEQLCGFITKGTTPAAPKLSSGSGEIPYVKVYNLTDRGALDFETNPTFVMSATHRGELARSRVVPGDVLMNIVGPPLGKVSIVPDLYPEWNVNQAIAIFRPMPSYNTRFLSCCLLSTAILTWALRRAKATAGQFNLTLEICRDLPLPVPPMMEQVRIVAEVERRLSVVDEVEMQVVAGLKRATRLRQSILKRAFEGRLAPQDPNDEAAAALLERICAQRTEAEPRTSERRPTNSRRVRVKAGLPNAR